MLLRGDYDGWISFSGGSVMTIPCTQEGNILVLQEQARQSRERDEKLEGTLQRLNATLQDFRVDMARMQTRHQVIVGIVGLAATLVGAFGSKMF